MEESINDINNEPSLIKEQIDTLLKMISENPEIMSKIDTNRLFNLNEFNLNGVGSAVQQEMESIVRQAGNEIIDILSPSQLEYIYSEVRIQHVTEDIQSHLEDIRMSMSQDDIEDAARRFVENGDYDCNLDYWSNIENLIYDYEKSEQCDEPDEYPYDEVGYNPFTGGEDPDL